MRIGIIACVLIYPIDLRMISVCLELMCVETRHNQFALETAREIRGESAHERQRKTIFPREGRLWNSCGTHKIHKRFLTESTGSSWVGKEQRDNVETVHTHLF